MYQGGGAVIAGLAAACTAAEPPLRTDLGASDPAIQSCGQWFAALDETVDRAGTRDGEAFRVPGYPYLRVDRFLTSFGADIAGDPVRRQAWVAQLRRLDVTARRYETSNLRPDDLAALAVPDTGAAQAKSEGCADVLARADLVTERQFQDLAGRARVPDDYVDWQRVVGLYPLLSVPFSMGVEHWHEQAMAAFAETQPTADAASSILRYVPASDFVEPVRAQAVVAGAPTDALGIPEIGREAQGMLFTTFAPVFEIETTGDYDRFGPLSWRAQPAPAVGTTQPVVYRRLAFTRYGKRVLLQLIYVIWFSERPEQGLFDLLSGRLDGIVFRVTLDPAGVPLVYDTIHPCGCYHMFFPTTRVTARPTPEPGIEWAFAPTTLPALDPAQRIVLRIESRTHYVVSVLPDRGGDAANYAFASYDALRALPAPDGGTRSAFGPDGIVPGTARGERFLFWPMGMAHTGSMRQWGREATAFLGRRHFDDADLIERRFAIKTMDQDAADVGATR